MSNKERIEQIEMDINQAEDAVRVRDALGRLQDNDDFDYVFNTVLFKEEAARTIALLAADNVQATPNMVEKIERTMSMIGQLQVWLRSQFQLGELAERSLKEHRNTRDELQAEV
jgi:hypothetical protein